MEASVRGRLTDRTAVVSGAANGIGRASALRLAREGANLALVDREGDTLREVARDIEAAGRQALAITVDWTDPVAVQRELFRPDPLGEGQRVRLEHGPDPASSCARRATTWPSPMLRMTGVA